MILYEKFRRKFPMDFFQMSIVVLAIIFLGLLFARNITINITNHFKENK